MSSRTRLAGVWAVVVLATLVVGYAGLLAGSAELSAAEVWGAVTHRTGMFVSDVYPEPSRLRQSILFELRLPRVLMGLLVGAALAVAGTVLQAITRNDLAEPYLLGISSGASAGAVIALTMGVFLGGSLQALSLTGGAAIGALVSFVVLMVLLVGSGFESTRVVLTGVLVGQFFAAVTSLVLMAAGNAEQVRGIMFWLLGALGAARWDTFVVVAIVTVLMCVPLWMISRFLDALAFGDATARTMGVPVGSVRGFVLVTVSLLTAATVSAVGAIGFVGLIIPHMVRMVVGPFHARIIPLAALTGGFLLVAADAIGRQVFAPRELPVGVVTALIGVPVFFFILQRKRA